MESTPCHNDQKAECHIFVFRISLVVYTLERPSIHCDPYHLHAFIVLRAPIFYILSAWAVCHNWIKNIMKSTTYAVFTTADPTTAIFGLSTCKWRIFALEENPLHSHYAKS